MIKPPVPHNEPRRLGTLRALNLLDTLPEERFDRFTRLAKRLFSVPIALVSLVDSDRQWFKSSQGLDAVETPRDVSFCGHAILNDEPMVVNDTLGDERFADNPLVVDEPNIHFYAGYPLAAPDGSKLGTLCIIDSTPRTFSGDDLALLNDLGRMVEDEIAALHLATVDELTGLSNRRGFETIAGKAIAVCRRANLGASLLYFDLDEFKRINDELGHAVGDKALVEFSACLLETFRESDVIARLGGDEFCVLLTGTSSDKLRFPLKTLKERLSAQGTRTIGRPLYCSVGVTDFDAQRHASLQDLLAEADRRMYERKRKPRPGSELASA